MAHAIQTVGLGHNVVDYIRHQAASLIAKYEAYKVYRATWLELDALGDRELADVGISRLQVEDVARQSAYGA